MRIPTQRKSTHPGVYIKEDVLEEMGITIKRLSEIIKIDSEIIKDIILEKSPISKEIAYKIAHLTKTSPDMWLNIQKIYDESNTKK